MTILITQKEYDAAVARAVDEDIKRNGGVTRRPVGYVSTRLLWEELKKGASK